MANVLAQLVYYLPGLVAYIAALAVAVRLHSDHRTASLMLGGGALVQLLGTAISFTTTALVLGDVLDIGSSSLVMRTSGVTASIIRAAGELLVVGAVWVAVRDFVAAHTRAKT